MLAASGAKLAAIRLAAHAAELCCVLISQQFSCMTHTFNIFAMAWRSVV
jgi:hypothetical protein